MVELLSVISVCQCALTLHTHVVLQSIMSKKEEEDKKRAAEQAERDRIARDEEELRRKRDREQRLLARQVRVHCNTAGWVDANSKLVRSIGWCIGPKSIPLHSRSKVDSVRLAFVKG